MVERTMRFFLLCILLAAPMVAQTSAAKTSDDVVPTIAVKTAGMKHMDGLLPLDWDAKAGKLYLEIPKMGSDMIYVDSLPFGTGSNDLGLDRGQLGRGRIVRFERSGPKVLLVEPNEAFRSGATDPSQVLAVTQSFPQSVMWGFKVAAETDGALLVDATDFFLSDVHHVSEALAATKQGAYTVDATRSVIALDDTKAFPKNTEVEAELTFTTSGMPQGRFVKDVTPDAHAMTVRERQSFVALPEPGFTPRRFDPRAGYFESGYRDYTVPLGDGLDQLFIVRHRLVKKNASCVKACEAVAPIQYYVDRGAPEPVRTALLEGARWWDQAYQAAGWAAGTFRVDLLPEGADPMDVRYNIIQWVHRYTRGWSYGEAVTDPRTGEIIKGNVTLGSLRGRQDYLIAEALLAPYKDGKAPWAKDDAMLQMVLARLRQLAAHETGHTLGLAHNFAASSYGQGASVMDYPHPYVTLDKAAKPELSHAYAVGIGDWDKIAINYGYREFAKGADELAGLNGILADAEKRGVPYITDEDARPIGSAHPQAHLWDNGADAADELDRVLKVRSAALARFGQDVVRSGTPMAQLEETLVPLYLFHRYQTEAAIKMIGGLKYEYNLRGDGQAAPEIVTPDAQKKALAAVLVTLSPETLTLPDTLLKIMPPHPPGWPRTQESLPSHTGLTFDPIAAAEASADLTLRVLLNPARASRLIEYQARVPDAPTLGGVLEAVSKATAARPDGGRGMMSEVERAVEFRAVEAMLALAANPEASSQARAVTQAHIDGVLKTMMSAATLGDSAEAAHRFALMERMQQFQKDPEKFVPAKTVDVPPGMPIGDEEVM